MDLVVSNPQKLDHWGGLIAPLLIPREQSPPVWTDLLLISLRLEDDHLLALCLARHWRHLSQRTNNECVCWPKHTTNQIPERIRELLATRQPVIVAECLSSANASQIEKLARLVEAASGKKVVVGVVRDEVRKHNGLDVRSPIGA